MQIEYAYKARENLETLPKHIQRRIAAKMRFYASQENPLAFAKRLTDHREGEFRFRVGDWRIFFDVRKNRLHVLRISHRGSAY